MWHVEGWWLIASPNYFLQKEVSCPPAQHDSDSDSDYASSQFSDQFTWGDLWRLVTDGRSCVRPGPGFGQTKIQHASQFCVVLQWVMRGASRIYLHISVVHLTIQMSNVGRAVSSVHGFGSDTVGVIWKCPSYSFCTLVSCCCGNI